MFNVFVRSILGQGGSGLLDLYIQYSLWINGAIILFYFFVVVLSRRNYSQILGALLQGLEEQYAPQIGKKTQTEISAFLSTHSVPWENGLSVSRFPFVCNANGWWPQLKSLKTLQRLYPVSDLAARLEKMHKKPTAPQTKKRES